MASKILDALQLSSDDHVVMRENLATYMAQLKPDFVERLGSKSGQDLLGSLRGAYANGAMRWGRKIERDVEKPYTDDQVLERLRSLQTELRDKVENIVASGNSYPSEVYVVGSLSQGRLAGGSDLDALWQAKDPDPWGRHDGDVHIQYTGGDNVSHMMWWNAFEKKLPIAVSDVQHGQPLVDLYRTVMAQKGYEVKVSGEHLQVHQQAPVDRTPEKEIRGNIMWDFSDLP